MMSPLCNKMLCGCVIMMLCYVNCIDVTCLLQLSVPDSTLKEFYETTMEDAKTSAKKAMVVSLTVSL